MDFNLSLPSEKLKCIYGVLPAAFNNTLVSSFNKAMNAIEA